MEKNVSSITFDLKSAYDESNNSSEGAEVKDNFEKEDMSITVRKIKNGWIVSRSWKEKQADGDYDYKYEDEYYEKNPL